MEALLDIRDLSTHFVTRLGVVKAVDGVNLTLYPGEIVGVVGESGSGKSVLSLSIMRLVQPPGRLVAGQLLFEGTDLLRLSPNAMRRLRGHRLAMIFQEPSSSMNPVLRIGNQLAEAVRMHHRVSGRTARQRVIEIMKMVGIPEPERRYRQFPHQFSGGMLQRMMIAMALVNWPSLLIADEPVTALDVTIQAQILELIQELRAQTGTTVLLISHDLGVVAETCDRIAVMYLGKIVEEAPVDALFSDPQHPYTQGLLDSIPDLEQPTEWLKAIPGQVPSPLNAPRGCRFSNRCPKVMDRCRESSPELLNTSPGHRVACHLYSPDADQRAPKTARGAS